MEISYFAAFVAGLISFFAPCVIPLLPSYVSYVTGVSLKDLQEGGYSHYRKQILGSSVFYVLGFSLVFSLLGTGAAGFGSALRGYTREIQVVGGFLILFLGLQIAGVLHLGLLGKERKLGLPGWAEKLGYGRAFVIGVIFAITWSPCVGAVLGSILALAAVSQTVWFGGTLLFVYSLGISVPFLIVSLTLLSAPVYLKSFVRYAGLVSRVAGVLLVLLGILLITGWYAHVNAWLFDLAFSLGYSIV